MILGLTNLGVRYSLSPFSISVDKKVSLPKPISANTFFIMVLIQTNLVDLARIELAPPQCECGVVPLNYRPLTYTVGLPRIELGLHEPESCVLPAYSSPNIRSIIPNFKILTRVSGGPCCRTRRAFWLSFWKFLATSRGRISGEFPVLRASPFQQLLSFG